MKVVYIKNNNNESYKNLNIEGYKFIPKRKNITKLNIINNKLTKDILNKRIKKDIKNIEKAINLMIKSNITETNDCIIMEKEIERIINIINNKYLIHLSELEYFDYIKKIYILNKTINLKKLLINSV